MLSATHAGETVLTADSELYVGNESDLNRALEEHRLRFHPGRLGGAWPRLKG